MLKLKYFTIILLGALFITFCKKDPENPIVTPRPSPDKIDTLLPKLSDFKLFYGDLKDMQATDNLFNYDLITPLYSDYAGKARFIFFPKGSTANYNNAGVLNFPEGTLILKTFYFSKDLRNEALGRKILETRVLFLKNGIWHSGNYHWNNEQTEAFLEEEEKEVTANWIDVNGISQTTQYLIPSNLDCEKCHKSNETLEPLGPKARNLNKLFNGKNQLQALNELGFLKGLPALGSIPKVPKWDDPSSGSLDLRARAYLDINCGHCHNENGNANFTILLNWEAGVDKLGKCQTPSYGSRSGGFSFDIVPGKADSSVMTYRMGETNQNKMPSIAKTFVHKEGVELIKNWINEMTPIGCPE